jgi:hypothetical protein
MEDIFNSSVFKFLFNLPGDKTVRYSSISERISIINLEFFRQSYDLIFSIFNQYYSPEEIEKNRLVRVDSTMVAEAANKLKKGMNIGKNPIHTLLYTACWITRLPLLHLQRFASFSFRYDYNLKPLIQNSK